jgi:hypothetical protein
VTGIPRRPQPSIVHAYIKIEGKLRPLIILGISAKVSNIIDSPGIAYPDISSVAVVFGGLHVGSERLLKPVGIGLGRAWFGVCAKGRCRGLVSSACLHL